MRIDNKTAIHRYGKALFELTKDNGKTEEVLSELGQIKKAVLAEPELMVFLKSAQISGQAKKEALGNLIKDASQTTKNLIDMLYDYGRISCLVDVIDEFNRLIDESNKTVRANVQTAVELDDDQKQRLASSFANVVGADKVILNTTIDPSIIGGVIVTANNTVYDGSLKTKLASIKRLLLK